MQDKTNCVTGRLLLGLSGAVMEAGAPRVVPCRLKTCQMMHDLADSVTVCVEVVLGRAGMGVVKSMIELNCKIGPPV